MTQFFDRDLSWLSFNYRVLLEAKNEAVPLFERIRFLSIYSSNQDEFFRVRMPEIVAANALDKSNRNDQLEQEIGRRTATQLNEYGKIFTKSILPGLEKHNIRLYYKSVIDTVHLDFIREYFYSKVLSFLQPLILDAASAGKVFLETNALYFAVALKAKTAQGYTHYSVINIPSQSLPRFIELPASEGKRFIAFLDDVIRENLDAVFPGYEMKGCYAVKLNRTAELRVADEFSGNLADKIEKKLAERNLGSATRFLYDPDMPEPMLKFLKQYLLLKKDELFEGGRYHNLRDLSTLPLDNVPGFTFEKQVPIIPQVFAGNESIFSIIKKQDRLLHLPYHSYNPVLRFFNEAAIDPEVDEVFLTIYRVAANSHIINALMSAAQNGKRVTVFVELKARFDEQNNVNVSKMLKKAGVKIVYSIPGLKVHAKTALVRRREGLGWKYYGLLSTGNFNESTARFYTDEVLMTAHTGITSELHMLFTYLQNREPSKNYPFVQFNHLLVAQFNLLPRFIELIEREMEHARQGHEAKIIIKLNNLQEQALIGKLYEASQAGVQIQMIVRSICCLIPGVKGMSENITVTRLVDRYLEHSRLFLFFNNGEEEIYMGSADWMNRNIYGRVEVCFPLYNVHLKNELHEIIRLQLADNTKAVKLNSQLENVFVTPKKNAPVNAQNEVYHFVQSINQ
jgi:polyphosphate kinase